MMVSPGERLWFILPPRAGMKRVENVGNKRRNTAQGCIGFLKCKRWLYPLAPMISIFSKPLSVS